MTDRRAPLAIGPEDKERAEKVAAKVGIDLRLEPHRADDAPDSPILYYEPIIEPRSDRWVFEFAWQNRNEKSGISAVEMVAETKD